MNTKFNVWRATKMYIAFVGPGLTLLFIAVHLLHPDQPWRTIFVLVLSLGVGVMGTEIGKEAGKL
jgi:hypothetical protein